MWKNKKNVGFVSSPQKSAFLIQKRSEIPISHSKEDEENREFDRGMPEMPILIDSNVISIDLQILMILDLSDPCNGVFRRYFLK